ncbi:spore maturation protein [Lawsonibacter sp. OA9]|uniref:spore maturation protein n=1 Tax=Oscillospiraceae TaxID=216572 RepID=UPI001F05614A|nr:nucleoside recognition domain-containing protein [Lawsonibacter sp. OA9]MCH1978826.1 spore maturation protein [Lawsonibacter sp. OA9]
MQLFFNMIVPFTICGVALYGAFHRVDVYSSLVQGAGEGLSTLVRIVPSLVGLMTAVYMLRASGALELAVLALAPLLERVGLDPELLPLMLVRPISGSAALGVGAELISTYGPDSQLGRTAAVMLGSTETTFYTIAVYFGAVGITRTRYAVPAALCADLTGFLAASWAVGLLFGG